MAPKAQASKAKTDQQHYTQLKTFRAAKGAANSMEKAPHGMGKNICKLYKLLKNSYNSTTIISNYLIKKIWAKDLNRHFSKDTMTKSQQVLKRCSTWPIIREMQIKITNDVPPLTVRTATTPKRQKRTSAVRHVETLKPLCAAGEMTEGSNAAGISRRFLRTPYTELLHDPATPLPGVSRKERRTGPPAGTCTPCSRQHCSREPVTDSRQRTT